MNYIYLCYIFPFLYEYYAQRVDTGLITCTETLVLFHYVIKIHTYEENLELISYAHMAHLTLKYKIHLSIYTGFPTD